MICWCGLPVGPSIKKADPEVAMGIPSDAMVHPSADGQELLGADPSTAEVSPKGHP